MLLNEEQAMLRDSAHIQEFETEWRNRKGKRSGEETFVPLYGMEDAQNVIKQFVPHTIGTIHIFHDYSSYNAAASPLTAIDTFFIILLYISVSAYTRENITILWNLL